jgi:hypothetical protein
MTDDWLPRAVNDSYARCLVQICSELSERMEKQQADALNEIARIKVRGVLCLIV